MNKRKNQGQSNARQSNPGQSKDASGTEVLTRHTGSLEHSRLDTTPTQDADSNMQYAGDEGKQRRSAANDNDQNTDNARRAAGSDDGDERRANRNENDRDNRRESNKDDVKRGQKQR